MGNDTRSGGRAILGRATPVKEILDKATLGRATPVKEILDRAIPARAIRVRAIPGQGNPGQGNPGQGNPRSGESRSRQSWPGQSRSDQIGNAKRDGPGSFESRGHFLRDLRSLYNGDERCLRNQSS